MKFDRCVAGRSPSVTPRFLHGCSATTSGRLEADEKVPRNLHSPAMEEKADAPSRLFNTRRSCSAARKACRTYLLYDACDRVTLTCAKAAAPDARMKRVVEEGSETKERNFLCCTKRKRLHTRDASNNIWKQLKRRRRGTKRSEFITGCVASAGEGSRLQSNTAGCFENRRAEAASPRDDVKGEEEEEEEGAEEEEEEEKCACVKGREETAKNAWRTFN